MRKSFQPKYHNRVGQKRFLNAVKRKTKKTRLLAGTHKHQVIMKIYALRSGRIFRNYKSGPGTPGAVQLPVYIKFLANLPELFSGKSFPGKDSGNFLVPKFFSLIDEHYAESFHFLKRLFLALYRGKTEYITLDYSECERIDVDASICMDLILAEIINYVQRARNKGYTNIFPRVIRPVNIKNEQVKKVLFSIGAYRNITGFSIKSPDVIALPVIINYKYDPKVWENSELHLTNIVEYIKSCLSRLGTELAIEAETEFYKVIGEIMSNAEEHSTMPHRFAIGYFQEYHETNDHYGVFNFTIFNYGDTIYETFKSPECKNPVAVEEMSKLSEEYTRKGWFKKADFEEETLWTLYAMQQGVTSKEKKRGNGSIEYIENFFRLKGNIEKQEASSLVVHSGHTRIIFDGSYGIVKNFRDGDKKPYKMITFNKSGDIKDMPDSNFVTFVPHYFPGTMISARILIKDKNTNPVLQ